MLSLGSGPHSRTRRFRAALIASTMLASGAAEPLLAQSAGSLPPPPVRRAVDDNGVDVIRGTYVADQTDLTIGGPGRHGLQYSRQMTNGDWRSSQVATISTSGSTYIVALGNASDSFTLSGSVYTPTEANGASLTYVGGDYIYTSRDGTKAVFDVDANYYYSIYQSTGARVTSINYPDGTKEFFAYKFQEFCGAGWEGGSCPGVIRYAFRLQSVTNSNGYQLKFTYSDNSAELSRSNYTAWSVPANVKAINNAVEYCDPNADSCSLSGNWPSASYTRTIDGSSNVTATATDPLGRMTRYIKDAGTGPLKIKRPGSISDNISASYSSLTGRVSNVTRDGVSYAYAYSDAGSTRTTTVTDPNSGSRVYVGDTTTFLISSYRDELNRTTSYAYDGNGRLTRVTAPEGNYTEYTYDARGNVTQTRVVAKTGSGLADIVTSATFPASCVSLFCNKPTSSTDGKGYVTDYTYDSTHGQILTLTAPAATTGGTRPQTRYTYAAKQAYYKPSVAGAPGASGISSYPLAAISTCQTTASCAGAADEVKTTIDYGPQVAGTGNNLLPIGVSSGSGNAALTATVGFGYDAIGNRLTLDGPLAGVADTTRTRYDAARQVIGVVSPDPDGAGALSDRAQRITYNLDGQVELAELGTVTDQSDGAWAAFSTQQQAATTFDANARPTKQELKSGGTTYSLSQSSYDALGRTDCSAMRMDPAVWASQTNACLPQTTGTSGPDRITKFNYNASSELTSIQSAYGTTEQATDVTNTYSSNGRLASLADGEANKTTYEYDGLDRLSKTRFPSPTQGSGTSSTTDFEQITYDANSNATQVQLRDAQVIAFTYDNLNRVTLKDLPGSEPDVSTTYDLLNRVTQLSQTGNALSYTYDALSRALSQTGPQGAIAYQYDLASRRTRTTWPDSFYVTYDYLMTGEITAIRENGAGSGAGVLGSYSYDSLGRRTTITRGNGTVTSTSFDAVSRLSSLSQDLAGTGQDVTFNGLSYNPASQIKTITRSNDAYAWGGHYNVNRNYTVNGLNQTTVAGATILGYDGRGNLTTSGANAYSYSSENLMLTGPSSVSLSYDPAMRLHQSVAGGVTTRLQYDGGSLITEYNGSNTMLRRYVHGPGVDEPLVWYEGSGTTDRRWLHADERGSVIAVSNGSGASIGVNAYDEYGIPAATNIGRFGYTGQTWLPELGMWYYKARMYSATLGRFMQSDPIGYAGGINLYAYAGGDPINFVDPWGLAVRTLEERQAVIRAEPDDKEIRVVGQREPRPSESAALLTAPGGPASFGGFGEAVAGGEIVVMATRPKPKVRNPGRSPQSTQCPSISPGSIGKMTEMQIAMSRPGWQVINAKRSADISKSRAEANFPSSQLWNGSGDAWRHFRWNFSMAQSMGSRAASAFANSHEVSWPNDASELAMDLHNNAMGREFASNPAAKNLSPDDAANLALRSGCLKTAP